MRIRDLKLARSGFFVLAFLMLSSGLGLSFAYADEYSAATTASQTLPSPSKEVESVTRDLLKNFQDNQAYYKKNNDAFVKETAKLLSPVIAFDSVARGVMGKYTRMATPLQIKQFTETFESSLISFYGKALLNINGKNIIIEKVDAVPDRVMKDYQAGNISQIPVTMTVKTSDSAVSIAYNMIFDEGRWKLRNIIVDGINIGSQFRRQFAEAVGQYYKNASKETKTNADAIQYVIDNWLGILSGTIKPSDDKAATSAG
ncbi:MAG: ABC transporter substrate-binding protein [Endozoicomonas sp. (ex Botrylloides leachii)]|nr:ABC transporter substrate-binding protein [Endozoicomonas sp. (ex Botrylloides leachii)]